MVRLPGTSRAGSTLKRGYLLLSLEAVAVEFQRAAVFRHGLHQLVGGAVRQMGVDLDGHRDIRADLAEGLCQVAVPRARSVGTSGIVRQANARHFAQYCRDRPTAETRGACAKQALTAASGLPHSAQRRRKGPHLGPISEVIFNQLCAADQGEMGRCRMRRRCGSASWKAKAPTVGIREFQPPAAAWQYQCLRTRRGGLPWRWVIGRSLLRTTVLPMARILFPPCALRSLRSASGLGEKGQSSYVTLTCRATTLAR